MDHGSQISLAPIVNWGILFGIVEDLFQKGIELSPSDYALKRMELSGYFCSSLLLGGEMTGKGHEARRNISPHLAEVVAVTAEQCQAKQEGHAPIQVEVTERPSLRKTLHDCLKNVNVNERSVLAVKP